MTNTCGPFDFVFLQDLSGSYADDLPILKSQTPNLIASLEGTGIDIDFAVASFIDKPTGSFGASGDYVYQTELAISSDNASVIASMNALSTRSGSDAPEAQLEGLLQTALRSAELGYRTGTQKVVMLSTDAAYHVAGDFASQPANNLDEVLDGTPPGTGEDYPTIDGLRAALVAADIFPVFSVTADVRAVYEDLVAQLGFGAVVTLTSDSANFSDAVRTALAEACGVITHPGTDGDDDIDGSEDDDGCFGGLGRDTIDGHGGDDIVDGGADDDVLRGGFGRDEVRGGTGNDDLDGEGDDDVLSGGLGNDTMTGGAGADLFAITAGDGTDEITDFEDGIDRLDLSSMDKTAAAAAVLGAVAYLGGTKVTFADGGSVFLMGMALADFDLSDVILDPSNAAPIPVNDTATTISTTPINIDVLANDSDVEGSPLTVISVGTGAHGTAVIEADGTVTYTAAAGFAGVDTFTYIVSDGDRTASATVSVTVERQRIGTPGDDNMFGDETGETFSGEAGNDTIDARGGDDSVDGGADNDSLMGGWGRDTINGGTGDDIIIGGPASSPDQPDDDLIDAGSGHDSVEGGAGNDTYVVNMGDGDDIIEEDAAPLTSFDTIQLGVGMTYLNTSFTASAGSLILGFAGGGSLEIKGQTETDARKKMEQIVFWDGGVLNLLTGVYTPPSSDIVGTSGNDTLTGTALADTIRGLEGNDRITALDGDDLIVGGAGNDTMFGQGGADTYEFSGAFGNDIVGDGINSTADRIVFTDLLASDVRLATNTADQLVIYVLATTDTVAISEQVNGVTIEDIVFADLSTIDLTGGLSLTGSAADDTIVGTAFGDLIDLSDGSDVVYGNGGNDTILGGIGNDVIYGDTNTLSATTGGADWINAQGGHDRVYAGAGNDTVKGGSGNDEIYGLNGNDILDGQNGYDTLVGGLGRDRMTGGKLADHFVMEVDYVRNVITDFTSGEDVLDFTALGITEADLTYRQIAGGANLLIDAGLTKVVLNGLTQADVDPITDFLF